MAIILIIDDDPIYHKIIYTFINMFSRFKKILSFVDGEEALAYLQTHQRDSSLLPEVILLDLNMPGLNGWGFLDEYALLRNKLATPIDIYITTSSDDRLDQNRVSQYPFVKDYVVKPLSENLIKSL
jgi:CheY-like chemotaxis protein